MNVVYQGLTFVFPLITVPWVSRALGVERIGVYSYTYSIAYIFMLGGMLGISNYGNRSIARVRDDKEALSREFSSIYFLQLVVNLIAVILYCLYLLIFKPEYLSIAYIQLMSVVSICFDVSWLYFGLEQFKVTITRNLIIKLMSLALIICFVKTEADLPVYAIIMSMSTLVSQAYLLVKARFYVDFCKPDLTGINLRIKDIVVLFLPVAAYSVYRVLDKTMLGSMAPVAELGLFENAEKLINIPISVITALGTVMLPRMSYILAANNVDYRPSIRSSMNLALMLAGAMSIGLIVISDDICSVLFGDGFEGCKAVIRLLSLTVICSAWSSVVRTQYLIPRANDGAYVGSTVGAAIVNLIINVVLIPKYGAIGACLGTLAAELFIVIYQNVATAHDLEHWVYFRYLLIHLFKSLIIGAVSLVCASIVVGHVQRLIIKMVVFFVLFFLLNGRYILHEFFGVKRKAVAE